MKRFAILFSLSMFSTVAMAENIQSTIHSINFGKNGEDHLIKLNSGQVVFMNANEKFLSPYDLKPGMNVQIKTDENSILRSVINLPPEEEYSDDIQETEKYQMTSSPTILPSFAAANNIFSGMNRSWKRKTECTDRAHIWSYEEWKKRGLVQNKVFLFFTNTYIRKYRFNWWFHTSPYTLVKSVDSVVDYVMDRRFSSKPLRMKTWTNIFVHSKKACPVATYAHYRKNKFGSQHCFVVKAAMYYRLPYHLRMKENYGHTKNSFSASEVGFSYRAFSRRGTRR